MVGLPICIVIAYAAIRLIGAGWDACDDDEPPYLFALLFGELPLLATAQWLTWLGVTFVTRHGRWWIGGPVALILAVFIGWAQVAASVPMDGPGAYVGSREPNADGFASLPATCGPDGIPTWWPAWLPV